MGPWQIILFLILGFAAGVINSVAGGGSLMIYPILLGLGIPPINANATTSFAVWPGSLSSAFGYRKFIGELPKRFYIILFPCIIGGLMGAVILKHTSNELFSQIVPWFFFLAVFLIAVQPYIHRWLYEHQKSDKHKKFDKELVEAISALLLFATAIYGGYFGAGFGIIMLGILGFTSLTDINEMNGLKNLAGASINIAAIVYFVFSGLIYWAVLPLLLVGSVGGGYLGARYSQRLPVKYIRLAIIIIGLTVAIKLLIKPI